ncbi:MAG: DUF192 domain-containing protein [Stigonema ocellatum SAG 48.90 = DSM 106950]|nr:DUF192 domain-containing protein [Stigonema ocellatum SAG 48.90 = DSM 106950]
MFLWQSVFSIVLGLLVISCSAPTTAVFPTDNKSVQTQTPMNLTQTPPVTKTGQQLPISGRAIVPNGTNLELEVARTPQQQEMGLMYRPALPKNRGMLFQFPSPQSISFWMKDTPVPLDIVFMRNGIVEYIAASVPPCTSDPCATYGAKVPIDQVIELRSGRAKELGLKIGDRVKIESLDSKASQ